MSHARNKLKIVYLHAYSYSVVVALGSCGFVQARIRGSLARFQRDRQRQPKLVFQKSTDLRGPTWKASNRTTSPLLETYQPIDPSTLTR